QTNIDDEVARLKGSIFVKLEPARKHFAELKARTERLANSLDEHMDGLTDVKLQFAKLIEGQFEGTARTLFAASVEEVEKSNEARAKKKKKKKKIAAPVTIDDPPGEEPAAPLPDEDADAGGDEANAEGGDD
ncbi:MAG: hypothetical protein AB7K09_05880, partial [Planctomycetota bacterium]